VRRYRAIATPKPEIDTESEYIIPLFSVVFDFGVGDRAQMRDPEEIVQRNLSELGLRWIMDVTIEEVDEDPENFFDEWLKQQPFGGPSRMPGLGLLSESTINLMRKAWNGGGAAEARLNAIRAQRQEQAFDGMRADQTRQRGDIHD
jgi:hypothetical protein